MTPLNCKLFLFGDYYGFSDLESRGVTQGRQDLERVAEEVWGSGQR